MYMNVGGDKKRYNVPHQKKVIAVFVGEYRNMVHFQFEGYCCLSKKSLFVNYCYDLSRSVLPIIYPLFFPRHDIEWHLPKLMSENMLLHSAIHAQYCNNMCTAL